MLLRAMVLAVLLLLPLKALADDGVIATVMEVEGAASITPAGGKPHPLKLNDTLGYPPRHASVVAGRCQCRMKALNGGLIAAARVAAQSYRRETENAGNAAVAVNSWAFINHAH